MKTAEPVPGKDAGSPIPVKSVGAQYAYGTFADVLTLIRRVGSRNSAARSTEGRKEAGMDEDYEAKRREEEEEEKENDLEDDDLDDDEDDLDDDEDDDGDDDDDDDVDD